MNFAITQDFYSQSEFDKFRSEKPEFFSQTCEDIIVAHCRLHGAWNNIIGNVPPEDVAVIGPEMREHFMIGGLNSRQRAVINEIVNSYQELGLTTRDVKIYGHEAVTPLALRMRGVFPKYYGTEYARTQTERDELWPIAHGDICQSDLPSGKFDIVMSCEVFEHVPDIDAALRESCRLLRSGGRFIGTFPFFSESSKSLRMAEIRDGKPFFLVEPPEYHGNPMDPQGGSLVFENPAWDILDRAREAGFSKAKIRLVVDQSRGIVASEMLRPIKTRGVFIAIFDK